LALRRNEGPSALGYPKICSGKALRANTGTCDQEPCQYVIAQCSVVGSWKTGADADGTVAKTVAFPVSPSRYQRVHVEADICGPSTGASSNANAMGAGCEPDIPTYEDI